MSWKVVFFLLNRDDDHLQHSIAWLSRPVQNTRRNAHGEKYVDREFPYFYVIIEVWKRDGLKSKRYREDNEKIHKSHEELVISVGRLNSGKASSFRKKQDRCIIIKKSLEMSYRRRYDITQN